MIGGWGEAFQFSRGKFAEGLSIASLSPFFVLVEIATAAAG
jgi:hypothetical protein